MCRALNYLPENPNEDCETVSQGFGCSGLSRPHADRFDTSRFKALQRRAVETLSREHYDANRCRERNAERTSDEGTQSLHPV